MERGPGVGPQMFERTPQHMVAAAHVMHQSAPGRRPPQPFVLGEESQHAEGDQRVEQRHGQRQAEQSYRMIRRDRLQNVERHLLVLNLFGEMPFQQRAHFRMGVGEDLLRQEFVGHVRIDVFDATYHRQAYRQRCDALDHAEGQPVDRAFETIEPVALQIQRSPITFVGDAVLGFLMDEGRCSLAQRRICNQRQADVDRAHVERLVRWHQNTVRIKCGGHGRRRRQPVAWSVVGQWSGETTCGQFCGHAGPLPRRPTQSTSGAYPQSTVSTCALLLKLHM